MQNINDETLHDNPFEFCGDIVEAAPSFNLIDKEIDDKDIIDFFKIL